LTLDKDEFLEGYTIYCEWISCSGINPAVKGPIQRIKERSYLLKIIQEKKC
jgi:hypothetical protein